MGTGETFAILWKGFAGGQIAEKGFDEALRAPGETFWRWSAGETFAVAPAGETF